ncbi:Crocetin glucosyltransferase 3 [Linum perenne]
MNGKSASHLIPFLSLANEIHRRPQTTITIAATPLNTLYLRSSLNSSSTVRLVDLPFSASDHGLPPGAENTENLSLDMMDTFFRSSTTLKSSVHDLLVKITAEEGRPPLCLIFDVFFGWASEVAADNKTLNVTFTTAGAYGTLAYASIWMNLSHKEEPDSETFDVPGFGDGRRFHITQLHQFLRKADRTDNWSPIFQPLIAKSLESHRWLCNSVEEIEPLGFDLLRTNRQIWGIDPLLPREFLLRSPSFSKKEQGTSFHMGDTATDKIRQEIGGVGFDGGVDGS